MVGGYLGYSEWELIMSKPEIITVIVRNYVEPLNVNVRDYINIDINIKP